jgi:microcystin degradation protein MlrC
MPLVIAQMKHETNTFSPVPTPLARFGHGRERPWEGCEAYDVAKPPRRVPTRLTPGALSIYSRRVSLRRT